MAKRKRLAKLHVASCTVAELFSGQPIKSNQGNIVGRLCSPEYQRPYNWQAKELEQLINDLLDYFKQSNANHISHQYYLGSIILHQSATSLNIIDGQQRLASLAILAFVTGQKLNTEIKFSAPSSHRQIAENVHWLTNWLEQHHELSATKFKHLIQFEQINITLVVTDSQDDAYRFFETQNTGGIRLKGADIIKAHHLRAIPVNEQDNYARQWEVLADLPPLLDAIMKVRYWQLLKFKSLPSHRNPKGIKQEVVTELATACDNKDNSNIAYRQTRLIKQTSGWALNTDEAGYAMRQPLNSGINAIDYLSYFSNLKKELLENEGHLPNLDNFYRFYFDDVIQKTDGTAYLKKLFDSTILLYASQFGTTQLFAASLWIFRLVYSIRVEKKQTVKEQSIPKLAKDSKLFDLIIMSYNQQQAIEHLKSYTYTCDKNNTESKNTKGRFISRVEDFFDVKIDREDINACYDNTLTQAIVSKIEDRTHG